MTARAPLPRRFPKLWRRRSVHATRSLEESCPAAHGEAIRVEAGRGSIRVRAREGDSVEVEARMRAEAADEEEARELAEGVELRVSRSAESVDVRLDVHDRGSEPRRGRGLEVTLHVTVPRGRALDIATGAGDVRVAEAEAPVRIRTRSGNVSLGAVEGELDVETGSGSIDVRRAKGRATLRTGAGALLMEGFAGPGPLRLATGAGKILARLVDPMEQPGSIRSAAGDVQVEIAEGVGLDLSARTRAGWLRSDFPLARGEAEGGWEIGEGRVQGGGPELEVETAAGDVVIESFTPS